MQTAVLQGLGLAHFDRVGVLLLDTLLELNVAVPLVEDVGRLVLSLASIFE
jgi:hypothetical protein